MAHKNYKARKLMKEANRAAHAEFVRKYVLPPVDQEPQIDPTTNKPTPAVSPAKQSSTSEPE